MPVFSKRGIPKLLLIAGGKPHATSKDHVQEPEAEDVERDPESSSSDLESSHSADIQPSFKKELKVSGGSAPHGSRNALQQGSGHRGIRGQGLSKKERRVELRDCGNRPQREPRHPRSAQSINVALKSKVASTSRRSPEDVRTDVDEPRTRKALHSITEDEPHFGAIAHLRASKVQHPGKTYNRNKTKLKFNVPVEDAKNKLGTNKAAFNMPPMPPIPGSSNEPRTQMGQKEDDVHPYQGAEDFVDEGPQPTKSMRDDKLSKGSKRSSKVRTTGILSEPPRKRPRVESASQASSQSTAPRSSAQQHFKMPETMTQANARFDHCVADSQVEQILEEGPTQTQVCDEGPCPMLCGKILPRQTLELLDPRATLKEQQEFCRKHQVQDAKTHATERGYPKKVYWKDFFTRLQTFRQKMKNMIDMPESLFHRKDLETRTKKQKNRTVFQQWQNDDLAVAGAGYYGPRGLEVIIEYITNEFSAEILEHATKDKLIAAQSASGYIEAVLAPEVATLLIQDDMCVSIDEARWILSETQYIGNLLHPMQNGKILLRREREVVEDDGS